MIQANTVHGQVNAVGSRSGQVTGYAGVSARVRRTGTGNGQHARLPTDAIRSHLGLHLIKAGLPGAPLEAPVHLDGAVALLDLTEQIDRVAHVYDILVGEGHDLGRNWVETGQGWKGKIYSIKKRVSQDISKVFC